MPVPTFLPDNLPVTLHDAAVRDLAWVIASPGLLDAHHPEYAGQVVDDAWCAAQLTTCTPWLMQLDAAPQALHAHIAARATRRLGLYFESLLAFWLAHAPRTQLIAANLPVREAGRTLGEYDLLWRDDTGVTRHWEAAVKFYLQAEPLPVTHTFIGPAARDRLDLKLQRVFQHQLTLSHTPAGHAALPPEVAPLLTQAFIKGYLFYPVHAFQAQPAATPGISPAHLRGWWLRQGSGALPQSVAQSRWVQLPRLRWLAPLRLDAHAEVMTQQQVEAMLQAHFAASSTPLQLVEVTRGDSGMWHEAARGFVVHAAWPQISISATSNSPH